MGAAIATTVVAVVGRRAKAVLTDGLTSLSYDYTVENATMGSSLAGAATRAGGGYGQQQRGLGAD